MVSAGQRNLKAVVGRMAEERRISHFALTAGGALLALKLRDHFGGEVHLPRSRSLGCGNCHPFENIAEAMPQRFLAGDAIVCVMAAGIVFRVLAPYLKSKQEDPAVIVVDEAGRHAVPLLGGHAAGANDLAREIAGHLGGEAVLTTSSDVQGLTSPDEVARILGVAVDDHEALRRVTAVQVNGGRVCIEAPDDPQVEGYGWVEPGGSLEGYDGRLLLTSADIRGAESNGVPTAMLITRDVAAGIGCHSGTQAAAIIGAIKETCSAAGIDPRAVAVIASVDLKEDEPGLRQAAAELGAELKVFPARELEALNCPGSDFVNDSVGTPAVSEPAALLAAGEGAGLLAGKSAFERITVALAAVPSTGKTAAGASPTAGNNESNFPFPNPTTGNSESDSPTGRVLVVGTGAGSMPLLTHEAAEAIRAADVVVGYRTYTEQLKLLFPGKEYISGSMGKEIERCRKALEQAGVGRTVALISSGDPGVYGMAGPVLEMANGIPVTVIPGVTAAQIAASRLGAPLMNDYVTLSLSDLLTPREEVLRRATAAAASDMVICLYNPSSRKRRPLFEEVCEILSRHRPGETPVGWLKDAGGPGEEGGIITLAELALQDVDMRTIIIVGNSKTVVVNGRMVTARGY